MSLNIIALGKLKNDDPINLLISHYIKQLKWKTNILQLEVKGNYSSEQLIAKESELILENITSGSFLILLDVKGKSYTSEEFTQVIEKCLEKNSSITFVIGGAFGVSEAIKKRANLLISLSAMTLPHMLARLILIEQIYRAYSITIGHPYHK